MYRSPKDFDMMEQRADVGKSSLWPYTEVLIMVAEKKQKILDDEILYPK